MSYKLYLDDVRPAPAGWEVVRTYDQFVEYITKNGPPDEISFDHDLDDFPYENGVPGVRERTGYDAARWLVENKIRVPKFTVHSMNPSGLKRIKDLMEDYLAGKFDPPKKITIPEVIERFKEYHKQNGAWGSLHIVLDDHNVEDSSVLFCLDWARENNDTEGAELAKILYQMSKTQRLKLSREA